MSTPHICNEKLIKEVGAEKVDEILYRNMVENLLYVTTRQYIMFILENQILNLI